MKQPTETFKYILKVLLGLVFCASAIFKFITIDKFDLYVYSYKLFSLNFCYLITRTLIAVELFIGIAFIANIYHRFFWYLYLAFLIGFTGFLIYAIIIGRQDNCHCFGDIVDFNPIQSIIKNGVLFLLLLPIYRIKEFHFWRQGLLCVIAFILTTCFVYAFRTPYNFTKLSDEGDSLNRELFFQEMQLEPFDRYNLMEGKKIVCLYSTACKYCKLSAYKITLMQQQYGLSDDMFLDIFWGEKGKIEPFYKEMGSSRHSFEFIDYQRFLPITNGEMPVIVFLDNGVVKYEFNYSNIDEAIIKKEYFNK